MGLEPLQPLEVIFVDKNRNPLEAAHLYCVPVEGQYVRLGEPGHEQSYMVGDVEWFFYHSRAGFRQGVTVFLGEAVSKLASV